MDGCNITPKTVLRLTRASEYTRLERQLMAVAYERILPIRRYPLASEQGDHARSGWSPSDPRTSDQCTMTGVVS